MRPGILDTSEINECVETLEKAILPEENKAEDYQRCQPKTRQKMQECKACHKMDDRNYKLNCGHQFCLFCLEFQIKQKKPCCNACSQPISMADNHAIWRETHCKCCDNWMSGSYGHYCENCWFESDEFAEKVLRSTAADSDNLD